MYISDFLLAVLAGDSYIINHVLNLTLIKRQNLPHLHTYVCSSRNVGLYTISLVYLGYLDSIVERVIYLQYRVYILKYVLIFLAFSILQNLIRHVTVFKESLNDEKEKETVNEC